MGPLSLSLTLASPSVLHLLATGTKSKLQLEQGISGLHLAVTCSDLPDALCSKVSCNTWHQALPACMHSEHADITPQISSTLQAFWHKAVAVHSKLGNCSTVEEAAAGLCLAIPITKL
jgi:hypothetical protein